MKQTKKISRYPGGCPTLKTLKVVSGVTLLCAAVAGCLNSENDGQGHSKLAGVALVQAETDEKLKNYLVGPYLHKYEPVSYPYEYVDDATVDVVTESETGGDSAFSQTNLIVEGVDEGDLWKYDGEHFYILKPRVSANGCYFQRTLNNSTTRDVLPCIDDPTEDSPAALRIVKNDKVQLTSMDITELHPSQLYLNSNEIWLVGKGVDAADYDTTAIQTMDVTDRAQPKRNLSIVLDGRMQMSRRYGDELILVTRYSPFIEGVDTYPTDDLAIASNRRLIGDLTIEQLLPAITINGERQPLVNSDDCYIEQQSDQEYGSSALSVVTRINLATSEFESACLAADVAGFHASQQNLYLFKNTYAYFEATDSEKNMPPMGRTQIHKFGLNDDLNYLGSGLVDGWLAHGSGSFRLGELSDGTLGLVTNKGTWNGPDHMLTVLKESQGSLITHAELPNEEQPAAIGKPGEFIYSVRFMQNRAYIVTFRKVDPLYVIDLSDTAHPKIAGELEIPGFSDYLHPVGDEFLIGVGKDAIMGASGTTWYQGVKVALFNVSDVTSPKETNSFILGKRGSSTALSSHHHAFAGIQQADSYRFALPVSVHNEVTDTNYWRDPESQFYGWSYTGLHLFEIKGGELTSVGAMKTEQKSQGENEPDWDVTRRGIIQGDDVYHLNGESLFHAKWQAPEDLSEKF